MKVPGGCDNLKAQAVEHAGLANSRRCFEREDAEGAKTSREALLVGVWCEPDVGCPENRMTRGQRLGVWAASEEELQAHERILRNHH